MSCYMCMSGISNPYNTIICVSVCMSVTKNTLHDQRRLHDQQQLHDQKRLHDQHQDVAAGHQPSAGARKKGP